MSWTGSDKIYRVLRLLAVLSAALIPSLFVMLFAGLAVIFLLEAMGLPDTVKTVVMILFWIMIYGLIMEFFRRVLIRRDGPLEKESYSRGQSIGIWLTPGILLWLPGFFLSWYFDNGLFLWFLPAGVIAALLLGFSFPFRRHVNSPVFGCLGPLSAFLIFLCGAFVIGRTGKSLNYTGDKVSEIPHLQAWQRQNYFPAGAGQIQVSGTTMAFDWECRLSEKDFLHYMQKCPFPFRKYTKTERRIPVPFYEHVNRARNGGGITLRYSVPEQKFYGSFSDH